MSVNWLDFVIVLIMVFSVVIGIKRGFGRTVFDFAAVLLALRVADFAYLPLSKSIPLSVDKQANLAWSYAMVFVVAGIILWFIGKTAYDTTLISLDTFDPPLGALLGFAIAIVIGHVFSTVVFLTTVDKAGVSQLMQQSYMGFEFLNFPTYHNVIYSLKHLGE